MKPWAATALVVAVLCAGTALASKRYTPALDPATREARAMVRAAAPEIRKSLRPMRAPAVGALATLLTDGVIPRPMLLRLLNNPTAAPFVAQALVDLADGVQHLPGVLYPVDQMARQHSTGGAGGHAFELHVARVLGPRIVSLSELVDHHEIDGRLADGTVLEMKGLGAPVHQKSGMIQLARAAVRHGLPGLLIGRVPFEEVGELNGRPWDLRAELARRGSHIAVAVLRDGDDHLELQVPSRHLLAIPR